MVKLLLSKGGKLLLHKDNSYVCYMSLACLDDINYLDFQLNVLVMNFDDQTALDLARLIGYSNVVHAIEVHIHLQASFSTYNF